MKVFISYATEDLQAANTVFREMVGAGADVFQFGQSEIFGKPSWEQVLDWITRSDVFIVILSRHALKSKPVREEIEQAHYSYINRNKPEKLVPAIIEAGVAPPTLIERFTQVDLTNMEAGLGRLMKQLNLARKAKPVTASTGLPDFGPLFAEFKRKNPQPLPANRFSAQADKVLSNYNKVAPKAIDASGRKKHVDGILAGLSGKKVDFKGLAQYDAAFLGLDPEAATEEKNAGPTTPKLALTLANFNLADWKLPLDTPVATVESDGTIVWQPVSGAMAYEVQRDPQFPLLSVKPVPDYRGTETRHRPLVFLKGRYRVRAVGGVFRLDSPWSNPVLVEPGKPVSVPSAPHFSSLLPLLMKAPVLEVDVKTLLFRTLRWSHAGPMEKYVLQRGLTPLFERPQTAYEGAEQSWPEFSLVSVKRYYRVKGVTLFGMETEWSNVVECG